MAKLSQIAENKIKKKRLNVFLAFLSAQPRKKQCIYTDGLHGWVIHFIWGDIFQHLGLDVSGPLSTTSASLSLFFFLPKVRLRAGSLRALGHGYLSHIVTVRAHTHKHTYRTRRAHAFKEKVKSTDASLFIYCINTTAVPSCSWFKPKAVCKQER